jgi:NhaP-type Na+/H+ or K+/H+ antiporter
MESILISSAGVQLFPFLSQVLAYIDPGTGSIIIQAIIGALVGVAIAAKLFWHRILKFLGIRKSKTPDNTSLDQGEDKK